VRLRSLRWQVASARDARERGDREPTAAGTATGFTPASRDLSVEAARRVGPAKNDEVDEFSRL
jgi:hypothetical protein